MLQISHPVRAAAIADVLHQAKVTHAGQGWQRRVHAGDRHKVDVVNRKILPAIYKIKAAGAWAANGGNVKLHRLRVAGGVPGAELDAAGMGLTGIAHAQRYCSNHRLATHGGADPRVVGVGIENQVHAALAVERHFARAVARYGPEAHVLQHLPQRLWPAADVLYELNAVDAQPVRHLWHCLAAVSRQIQGRCIHDESPQ